MNQLSGGLIDERLGGTEQGERTVGGIDESGKGGVRRQRSREQSGIHAITNEGVPYLEDDIHGDLWRGVCSMVGRIKKGEGRRNNKFCPHHTSAERRLPQQNLIICGDCEDEIRLYLQEDLDYAL